jgi:hypothetical protein
VSRSTDTGAIVELAILPGLTDYLEVRLRRLGADGTDDVTALLVGRLAVSDIGDGSDAAHPGGEIMAGGGNVSLLLRPRDAEMVASMILEASRRALAIA